MTFESTAVVMPAGDERAERRNIRLKSWQLAGVTVVLWLLLRVAVGPLPQWLTYHDFADERTWLGVPRAGDVLTNLAILAAGLWGASLARRVRVDRDERIAYLLLVVGAIATAFGSAWYHLAPDNATLVWDRLPMAAVMTATLALVMADRIDSRYGRESLVPLGIVALGSVVVWALTEWAGRGDLLFYLIVRTGIAAVILWMLVLRTGRHSGAVWLLAAVALNVVMVACEGNDRAIWAFTGETVSGHNLKHLIAGGVIACLFAWLVRRRPQETDTNP